MANSSEKPNIPTSLPLARIQRHQQPEHMANKEIKVAVEHFMGYFKKSQLGAESVECFKKNLVKVLTETLKDHWYPVTPYRGSGYRCVRINEKFDPVIKKACEESGVTVVELKRFIPSQLTVWIDPGKVSYRIGEEGSICVIYDLIRGIDAP